MEILKAVTDFASAIDNVRAELASVNTKIDKLKSDRQKVEFAKPHTDDIVAAFLRQSKHAEGVVKEALASRLKETFFRSNNAAKAVDGIGFDLLRLEANEPSLQTRIDRADRNEKVDVSTEMLTLLLADKIHEAIPAWVDGLLPEARDGMKSADRKAALAEIDRQLAELHARREELLNHIQAGREAILPEVRRTSPTYTV